MLELLLSFFKDGLTQDTYVQFILGRCLCLSHSSQSDAILASDCELVGH